MLEVSIGHALIADALEFGLTETVREYLRCIDQARGRRALIYGIGTDICDIRRIEATLARRGDRFAERVLGIAELASSDARRARTEARGVRYLATRFSAKEAFSKAIGLGIRCRCAGVTARSSTRPVASRCCGCRGRWPSGSRLAAWQHTLR